MAAKNVIGYQYSPCNPRNVSLALNLGFEI